MTDAEREQLKKAYAIVDAFRNMVHGDIQEKTGTLYMDGSFQGLESAVGTLGQLIDEPAYERLTISVQDTRDMLSDAATGIQLAGAKSIEGSELEEACLSLESCVYAVLNMTWGPDVTADASIEKVLSASEYALEIVTGLENAGRESFSPMLLNPSGDNLYDRLPDIRKAFEALRPRYDPDKAENGGNGNT